MHPYHAKFIPAIPKEFIYKYSKVGDTVLDPFCGSGTSLLESLLAGRNCYGVDLNNIAVKIARAKIFRPSIEKLDSCYNFILENFNNCVVENPVCFENKQIWFTNETSNCIDKILYLISNFEENYKNIFEVLVSSILKTVSNKRDVWNNGYIADNVLPNKPYNGDCLSVFKNRYKSLKKAYCDLIENLPNNDCKSEVYLSNILDFNLDQKVDLVVTSPPYPFAVDFVRYNRLSYYWFGWDINSTFESETGSRGKRSRKNAINDFFSEMEKLYIHIFSLVKSGGYFCMTVADTHRKNEEVSFIKWLYSIFTNNGWVLESDEIRELSCQSMAQKRIAIEHKLVFKKK